MKTNVIKVRSDIKRPQLWKRFGILKVAMMLILCTVGFANAETPTDANGESISPQQTSKTVRVYIIDALGEVAGANVSIKGTTIGNTSNAEGYVTLNNVPVNSVIVVSYVGYETQEIAVDNRTEITVTLKESSIALQEVVAVGYGSLKSSQVTNAITKVTNKDISDRPATSVVQAMQGKIAGVTVQEISGSPGRAFSVKVRGTGSINYSSSPLYVVDGFPLTDISYLNPSDIESIEVLKDAASAAIYGSRGANGVVLVTTKQGKKGKPIISLDVSYSAQKRFSKVDVLNRDEWIEFALEERINSYNYIGGDPSIPEADRTTSHQYGIDPLWRTNPTSFPDHDWQDLITQDAPLQNYGISVAGANDNARYFISGNYIDQKGIILNSWYKKLTFASNVEVDANKWVTMGLNLKTTYSDRQDPDTDGTQSGVARSVLVAPVVGLDQQTQDGGYYKYHAAFYLNPIHFLEELENRTFGNHYNGNIYLVGNILPGLKLKTSFGAYVNNSRNNYYKTININRGSPSFGTVSNTNWKNLLNENTINYTFDKDKWSINLLGGFTYQKYDYYYSTLQKNGFPDDEIHTLNVASSLVSGSSNATEWALLSWLGRANVAYDGKYIFGASIRRDGCSRFGADNRWGTFPSVSGAWLISEEKFYEPLADVMNNLKLRVSYGVAGNNEIGDYAAIGLLNSTNAVINGTVTGGYIPGGFSNKDLGWEMTHTSNAGLDMGFLKNRLNLSFDYYIANTKDLLLQVQIPETTGFTTSLQNIGEVQNRGFDIELNTKNVVQPFTWTTNFNLNYNHNEVKKLGPDGSPIYGYSNGFMVAKTEIGHEIGAYYMFQQDGLFKDEADCKQNTYLSYANKKPQPGDIKYKDINGDGVLDDNDKTYVGSNRPKFTWGMTNSFGWKGFELSIFLDGVSKCEMLNIGKKETTQSRGNVKGYWRDRWRSESNPGNGKVPRACTTDNLTTPSSWWLEDATFWRIRNVNLSYSLQHSALKHMPFLSGCKIYFSVDNLYMHDNCDHAAQNATDSNTALVPGIYYDTGYPLARTWTLGMNIQF